MTPGRPSRAARGARAKDPPGDLCAAVQRGGKSYFGTGKSFKFFWNKRLKEACTPDEEETSKSLILFKSIFLLHLFKSTEKKSPTRTMYWASTTYWASFRLAQPLSTLSSPTQQVAGFPGPEERRPVCLRGSTCRPHRLTTPPSKRWRRRCG